MKKIIFVIYLLIFSTLSFAKDFKIQSSSWKDNSVIENNYVFNGLGCSGQNLSPQISWSDLPSKTKSVAITVYDPDAPTGSGWWHWIVYNIPTTVKSLSEGEGRLGFTMLANGAFQGKTDFGTVGYGGPCPPVGNKPHHYVLTVFALDIEKLNIDASATGAMIGFNINAHTLAKSSLTSLYSR